MTQLPNRILGIQGLRAIAVLLVVTYHLGLPVGAGFVGVDVFFVISGFVITAMILRQSLSSERLNFGAFWAGRVRRLLPALSAMVVLTAVLATLFASPLQGQTDTGVTGLAASAWVSNGVLAFLGAGYFAHGTAYNPLTHTWSLAVEEQFYLFFPMLVAACLWWTRRFKGSATARIARWLAVVGVISLALCLLLTFVRLPVPVGGLVAFYSPFTRAWEFVAGALLALAFQRGWTPPGFARFSGPMGAGVLLVGLVVIQGGARFPGWYAVIPVVATVLLLVACVGEHPGARLLTTRPMVYIGDISYGWYLFHWPLIAFAGIAWQDGPPVGATIIVAVLGFALAAASHRWIEQPIRERRVLGTMRAPLLLALVVLPAVLASAGLIVGAQRGWGQQDVRSMQAQLDHGQWQYQEVCQSWVPVGERDFSTCRIEGDPDKRPLILMGDSNAGVYAELMVEVAKDLNRTVTIATVPSCPLLDVETVALDGASLLDCRVMFRSSMEWLADQPSSTVVMASGGGGVDLEEYALRLPQGRTVREVARKGDAWRASLERSYAELDGMGHEVIQVELAPHFDWRPSGCSFVKILRHGVARCGVSESRADADADAAQALAAERTAVEVAGIRTIEVRNALCPQGRCRTNEGNVWYYEDGVHLSFGGALSLEPRFAAVLGDDPGPERLAR